MGDDYLWDRSGEPDPEIARLERALGTLKYTEKPVPIAKAKRWRRLVPLAAVAALAAGAALYQRAPHEQPLMARHAGPRVREVMAALPPTPAPEPPADAPRFEVKRLAGAPKVGAGAITDSGQLALGQVLETDAASRAKVQVADIGEVEVGEGSRLKLSATGPQQHRLDLERGEISAWVNAPPRLFVVGTPAATAVDLGCSYTLTVDDEGATLLRVKTGWVALEDGLRSSYVPAGAAARTRKGARPGIPFYEDAPKALKQGIQQLDEPFDAKGGVRTILSIARKKDALTVWHLIARAAEDQRAEVVHRLATLAPPPPRVKEAEVIALDPAALDAWRMSLRIGVPITW